MWVWRGKAGREFRLDGLPGTYQGSSSNTGLFRVRKRRMTGLPSWTRGFPRRNRCDRKAPRRQNPRARQRTAARTRTPSINGEMAVTRAKSFPTLTFHEHSQTLPTGVPDHGVSLSPKSVSQESQWEGSAWSLPPHSLPQPCSSPFVSVRCLYCRLGQIRHDGG